MSAIERVKVARRMSTAVIHGDTVYIKGFVASGVAAGQSVAVQTTDVLRQIEEALAEAGTDKTKLLQATIWLADITSMPEMNAVWDEWVPEGHAPVRACVEARLATPKFAVEIRVIAAR